MPILQSVRGSDQAKTFRPGVGGNAIGYNRGGGEAQRQENGTP